MISSYHLNTEVRGHNVAEKEKRYPWVAIEGVDSSFNLVLEKLRRSMKCCALL